MTQLITIQTTNNTKHYTARSKSVDRRTAFFVQMNTIAQQANLSEKEAEQLIQKAIKTVRK